MTPPASPRLDVTPLPDWPQLRHPAALGSAGTEAPRHPAALGSAGTEARGVDDFIVSFPKSGRTWLRVLLAAAIALHHRKDLGTLVGAWLDSDLLDMGGRSLLFTHALANRMEHGLQDMRRFAAHLQPAPRILLLRDPRDTVVSYFFQRTRRPRKDSPEPVPQDLSEFVRHPALGIDRIIEFTNLWIAAIRAGGPAMTLAYEDLHADPQRELHRCLLFFGIEVHEALLHEAVEFADFSNMRRMEAGEHFVRSKKLRAYDPSDIDTFKTRQGKVGGYRLQLASQDIDYIESRIRERLDPAAGYREPGVVAAAFQAGRVGPLPTVMECATTAGPARGVETLVDVVARETMRPIAQRSDGSA
jgi:hypothetical protein